MAEAVPIARNAADEQSFWLRAAGIAACLHSVVFAIAVLTVGKLLPPPRQADTFRVMMLPAPATDIPTGIVQDEQHIKPVEQRTKPLPIDPPPELDTPAPAAITIPKPADRPATPASKPAAKDVETMTRPPAAPVSAPPTVSPPVASAASGAPSAAWQAKLLAQLERNKRYPAKARYFRQQDTVLVRFTMSRAGSVLSSKIVKSQGFADIDAEVLALLKRSEPLIPPPPEVIGDPLTETVAIQFYLN